MSAMSHVTQVLEPLGGQLIKEIGYHPGVSQHACRSKHRDDPESKPNV